jgi:hypothetical protein
MKRNVITALCIAAISMTANAMPNTNVTTVVKPAKKVHLDWCLDHAIDSHTSCATAIGYVPGQDMTVILHVNKYIPNSNLQSDPVYVQCNNTTAIVNAGESYTCVIRPGQGINWRAQTEYKTNGVNGTLFWAEGATAE